MRSGPIATVWILLGLVLTLSACGDEETTAAGEGASVPRRADTRSDRADPEIPPGAHSTSKQCVHLLGNFLDSVESLNNALAVGLSYADYLSAVDNARTTYASVPVDRLPIACLSRVGGPAEQTLNAYIDAANSWGDCLATTSCDIAQVEPELKRRWAQASRFLSLAESSIHSTTERARESS